MSLLPESASLALSELACGDVDVSEFKERCRIPLFPQKWNVWVLLRSLEDNPTVEQMCDELKELFGCDVVSRNLVRTDPWFYDRGRVQGLTSGFFLIETDQARESFPPPALADWDKLDKSLDVVAARFQGQPGGWEPAVNMGDDPRCAALQPPPGNYTAVTVAFVYRGHDVDMAWPVNRRVESSWLKSLPLWAKIAVSGGLLPLLGEATTVDLYCPTNARWVVSDVLKPGEDTSAVPEPSDAVGDACRTDHPGFSWAEIIEAVTPGGAETIEAVGDAAKMVATLAVLGFGVYVFTRFKK